MYSRPSRNPFARNRNSEDSSELVVKENPALKSPVTTPPSKQSNKFSALSKFARAVQRTSTEGKPIVQSRYLLLKLSVAYIAVTRNLSGSSIFSQIFWYK